VPRELRLGVREVCIDMDTFYKGVAEECFPNARIVIDKFHVIQWAIQQMEDLIQLLQNIHKKKFKVAQIIKLPADKLKQEEWKKLKACFDYYPDLKRAWKIVQQVRRIYRQNNWKKANSELRKTIWRCEQSGIDQMNTLAGTLKRWKDPILNYYISRLTNAYTEGLHNKFETLRRGHCGIRNVERFAKRLMFCMLPFSVITTQFLTQSCS
jgi:transposase